MAPGKLHPLWYSAFIPVFFFISSIYAGFCMVIAVSTVAVRYLREKADHAFLDSLDGLTVGLGKAACIVMFVYFALRMIGVAHDDNWALLSSSYGYWFLTEVYLFVLLPCVVLTVGVKRNDARIVRAGAFHAIAGVILTRLNISILMFNWNLPGHFQAIVPPAREVLIVLSIITLHILIFRWILNRMPVMREDPAYLEDRH
jgi:Ni/Fe-hydrogenase subunit HybB-like protein